MDQIVILDRQPMLRLGLKLLLNEKYQEFSIREAHNFDEFCGCLQPDNDVSIFILGLDPEKEKTDLRIIRNIKRKFPDARIVLYADNMESMALMMCFRAGIAAYIPKQSTETELIECLQSVRCKKRYLSSQILVQLTKDPGQYPGFLLPQSGLRRGDIKYRRK
ncbi:hypothetical protein [Dyadobacter sp. CY312]|uniref:hypothetical protein n=1 Tax=Dyadobacter sp. CY312 TaxID=2907303 RepID=UPI001F423C23|nr:hypothetical protein [Dyadobacter sp. CY312]MCE7043159.1 hypothetical protein [Dyadobacter sp. CY312]